MSPLKSLNKPSLASLSARKNRLRQAIACWQVNNPAPACELYYETPYQLLISVVMSAQTTDKMVNRCMELLYRNGLTLAQVLAWGEVTFLSHIRSVGLAPTKARNVLALSRLLLEKHGGEVPDNRVELEALPGVGRKTANVVLGELFHQPTLAVDTHVLRVSARLGLHGENAPEKAEREMMKLLCEGDLPRLHHWLVLHGRYVCKAQRPLCDLCELRSFCPRMGL